MLGPQLGTNKDSPGLPRGVTICRVSLLLQQRSPSSSVRYYVIVFKTVFRLGQASGSGVLFPPHSSAGTAMRTVTCRGVGAHESRSRMMKHERVLCFQINF